MPFSHTLVGSEEELQQRIEREIHTQGPLFRSILFELGAQSHVLLLLFHPTVMDIPSLEIFVQEMGMLYVAEKMGVEIGLPLLPAQYVDYAPSHEPIALQVGHGSPLFSKLPTSSTPLLLSAFSILLSHHLNQAELIIGWGRSGRDDPKFSRVVGCFSHAVPIQVTVVKRDFFATLLQRMEHPEPIVSNRAVDGIFNRYTSPLFPDGSFFPFALGIAGGRMNLGGLLLESMELPERTSRGKKQRICFCMSGATS